MKLSPEKWQEHQTLKLDVMKHYSPGKVVCDYCGEDDIIVLTINHIKNDGAEHRRPLYLRNEGMSRYRWLKKNNYPEGYHVLCRNCQIMKEVKIGGLE